MIKAIIFDFDGVIIESADIKTEAFKEIFSDFPEKIVEITGYHLANSGISRYVKFRYIYERILERKLPKGKEIELGKRFSQIALEKVLKASFVDGAKEFLDKNKNRYQLFIVSGTPEQELNDIIKIRGLREYFREIHGSPKEKTDVINDIMKKHNFSNNEVVYVGDAESDRIAAQGAKVIFIERKINCNSNSGSYFGSIKDLSDFGDVLKRIENNF